MEKKLNTTEFYRNPSKAVGMVKDGETVYLGYKNLKEPFAVIIDYKTYKKLIEKPQEPLNRMDIAEKFMVKGSKKWTNSLDMQNKVRD